MKSRKKRGSSTVIIKGELEKHSAELAELNAQVQSIAVKVQQTTAMLEAIASTGEARFRDFVEEVCRLSEADTLAGKQMISNVLPVSNDQPQAPVSRVDQPAQIVDSIPILNKPVAAPSMPVMLRVTKGNLFGESIVDRVKSKRRKTGSAGQRRRR